MSIEKSSPINITIYDKSIKFIQNYICNIIHNPIISSVIILSYVYYQFIDQIIAYQTTREFEVSETSTKDDFYFDILSNFINLVFITRFQLNFNPIHFIKKFKNLSSKSSYNLTLGLEILFFNLQLCSCIYLIYKFITIYSQRIQFFIILQIFLPFLIFGINYINHSSLLNCIKECNNNFLPFFISNSFLFINFKEEEEIEFPTPRNIVDIDYFFKLASYSFKFYLIYQFIIYELNQIKNCESNDDEEDYEKITNVFYDDCYEAPNSIKKRNWFNYSNIKNWLMILTCFIMISFDLFNINLFIET